MGANDQTLVFARYLAGPDTLNALLPASWRRSNQIDLFTRHQIFVQRVLAVSSSTTSIVFCLIALYAFLAIDPKRLVFRHQLIAFLLFFDMLKAVILLLYPSRVLTQYTAYYNDNFCQVVGFFTAVAIEGADMAILSFAIHTFLLIYKPNSMVQGNFSEGGLYKVRYYVYVLSFIIPIILASLAFIGHGYYSFVCWCYLPEKPVWYRFVLSWVPRYVIVVIIITVYCAIYFHVIKEFKEVGGIFAMMHKSRTNENAMDNTNKPSFFSSILFSYRKIKEYIFPTFILPEINTYGTGSTGQANSRGDHSHEVKDKDKDNTVPRRTTGGVDLENIIDDSKMQAANFERFKQRQKLIEKQMKSIFVYPFAYCFIWLFPFLLHIVQVNYEEEKHPIYWLNVMGSFMQPFNGFVDSLVFFYRERPWEHTIMRNFERENSDRIGSKIASPDNNDDSSFATSARYNKNSLSASFGIDIEGYAKWRRIASWLRLPLLKLPTDENISDVQYKYLNRLAGTDTFDGSNDPLGSSQDSKHDYSNLVRGQLVESDFRMPFANAITKKFTNTKKDWQKNGGKKAGSRARQLSVIDPLELEKLNENDLDVNVSSGGHVSRQSYPSRNNLRPIIRADSSTLSSRTLKGNLDSTNTIQKLTPSKSSSSESSDMGFLEFLKQGPQ